MHTPALISSTVTFASTASPSILKIKSYSDQIVINGIPTTDANVSLRKTSGNLRVSTQSIMGNSGKKVQRIVTP